jgi:hypothetical protein
MKNMLQPKAGQNSLHFPQSQSKLVLEETFNEEQVEQLLQNPSLVALLCTKPGFDYEYKNGSSVIRQLQQYKAKSKNGVRQIEYGYAKRTKGARQFTKGEVSMQNLPRKIRYMASYKKNLRDFDIGNANPVFLQQLCAMSEIKCPLLDHYVSCREDTLSYLQGQLSTDREGAKQIILKALFGGNVPNNHWLKSFAKECESTCTSVCAHFPVRFHSRRKKKDPKKSTLAIVIQEIENMCLQTMIECATEHDVTVRVLAFDGFMVEGNIPEDFCELCSSQILMKTGFKVDIAEKVIPKLTVDDVLMELEQQQRLAQPIREEPLPLPDMSKVFLETNLFNRIPSKHVSCCAAMQMGKTERTIELIKQFISEDKTVLIITQRISMANTTLERLKGKLDMQKLVSENAGFVMYQDINGKIDSAKHKYVICEYESINRIEGVFDLVVLDEWRSINSTIVSKTNGLNTVRHYEMLKNFTLNASKVLYLDADMKVDGCGYATQDMLALHDATVLRKVYSDAAFRLKNTISTEEYNSLVHKAHEIEHNPPKVHRIDESHIHKMSRKIVLSDTAKMLTHAASLLQEGKRVILICASILDANMYKEYLSTYSLSSIGLYTSKTDNKDDTRELQSSWDKYTCIIFTSTITTGADYTSHKDVAPLHTAFVFPHQNSCTARDIHQMIGRARELFTNEVWVSVPKDVKPKATTRAVIDAAYDTHLKHMQCCRTVLKRRIDRLSKTLCFTVSPEELATSFVQTPNDLLVIGAYNDAERSFTRSNRDWFSWFMYMAEMKNYRITTCDEPLSEQTRLRVEEELEELSDTVKAENRARMNALNVRSFITDHDNFTKLKKLASGVCLSNEDANKFQLNFPEITHTADGYRDALMKATACRLYPHLSEADITAAFVKKVHRLHRTLLLHDMSRSIDRTAPGHDFFTYMQHQDVPELRSVHIMPLYTYTTALLKSIGLKGMQDKSIVVRSKCKEKEATEMIDNLKALGITRGIKSKKDVFQEAVQMIETITGLGLHKLTNRMTLKKEIKDLLIKQPCFNSPEVKLNHRKPAEGSTLEQLRDCLNSYSYNEDFKGPVFEQLQTELRNRIHQRWQHVATTWRVWVKSFVVAVRSKSFVVRTYVKPTLGTIDLAKVLTTRAELQYAEQRKRPALKRKAQAKYNYPGMSDAFKEERKRARLEYRAETKPQSLCVALKSKECKNHPTTLPSGQIVYHYY